MYPRPEKIENILSVVFWSMSISTKSERGKSAKCKKIQYINTVIIMYIRFVGVPYKYG